MSNIDSWAALSARIQGMTRASELCASLLRQGNDSLGAMLEIREMAAGVLRDLAQFAQALDESAKQVRAVILRATSMIAPLLSDSSSSTETRQIQIRSMVVWLAATEVEISYLLSDQQAVIRGRTERGFEHIQRLIVVDANVRKAWSDAFQAGEVECERLGAVHLLGHGIWAFKVNASGGRTDLVYQEPITDLTPVRRSAEGLVLTEWKRLPDGERPTAFLESARGQLKSYATGVLAGIELARVRYVILVSRQDVPVGDDIADGGVIYRHINIAVDPRVPSRR